MHAKIARGAFAHWIIKNRIDTPAKLSQFDELGYTYNDELSSANAPVYVCQVFGGIGLSVRLR